jgi:hypothetical protein
VKLSAGQILRDASCRNSQNGLVLRARPSYAVQVMELSKLPIEKVFFFIAGIIPGFVALLLFDLAHPGSFLWFFGMGFLGYKTKLGIILLTAFVIGNSMTTFLSAFLGAAGGIMGAKIAKEPYKPPESFKLAPWRDKRWRTALRRRLGQQTPKDTVLMGEEIFNIRVQAVGMMPEAERPMALTALSLEKLGTEMDELAWAGWYDRYHHRVLISRDNWDVQRHVLHGLNFNLETTALYTLLSTPFVASLRHWWCILPAVFWTLILIAEQFDSLRRFKDPWSTLTQQIDYLSDEDFGESLAAKTELTE